MNKFISFLAVTILISLPFTAFAHAGKTDSSGGHYDHSAGEYHYHHGYPAHSHSDGTCPYDYDDQTDHSSGSSSFNPDDVVLEIPEWFGSTECEPLDSTLPITNETQTTSHFKNKSNDNEHTDIGTVIFFSLLAGLFLSPLPSGFVSYILEKNYFYPPMGLVWLLTGIAIAILSSPFIYWTLSV